MILNIAERWFCHTSGFLLIFNATIVKAVSANSVIVPARNRIVRLDAHSVDLPFESLS